MLNKETTDELDSAATDGTSPNARDGAEKRREPSEPAAVVGLGASAGGIAVLQQFFSDMPPESGLAFVVVMHLSPEHESNLASILQLRTSMPVAQVTEAVKVQPNHVYVIPPGKQLTFTDSMLDLAEPQEQAGRRATIDLFFRTLAYSYGQRSVCIVLSGTASDGVIGLKHIRAQGGVTIAQDPHEAEHDSMPVTAISTGMVDWVLPVAQMPGKLMEFVRNEHAMRLPSEIEGEDEPDRRPVDFESEVQFLKQQLSLTIEQYEGTAEELKASNEELQAMNEEMRSATEELETSKEELQSVNEELITVNSELKSSVEERSRANTDLNNLMASTDIGTILLDRRLRIERFTPSAQKIFNLIPSDAGRPISDITHRLTYDGFVADAETVLSELRTLEREVHMGGAKWYLTRLAPYRTQEDRIAGVVVTFIDITARKSPEQQLRASEERYRTLFNSMNEAYCVIELLYDDDGAAVDARLLELNPAFESFTGIPNAVGRTLREALPNIASSWVQLYAEIARTGTGERFGRRIPELGNRWFDGSAFRVGGEGSRIVAVVFSDISEQKDVEDALRDSEEQFRTLANTVPQLIWTNNARGEANYFNDRWYQFSGLTYEEPAGPGWQAIVHPEDAPHSIEKWQHCFAAGKPFESEFRLRRKDGVYRWHIGRNMPSRDALGKAVSWFGSATDVEEFKRADEALRQSEERFRLLVEGAPDYAMFLLDTENRITYWSTGAQLVFGWTPEEAIGQTGSMFFTAEDREKGEDQKELKIALVEGSAPDRRWHVRKDGTRLWLDGFMRRLEHSDGTLRGFAKVAREATDQKMAEEKLKEAHDNLEQRVHDRTKELQAMNETLEQEMARRQRLESEILQVTERERARISQDLHDSLCQELTATAFLMKSRARSLGRTDPEAGEALSEAAEAVNKNAGLARDLARGLHPLELGPGGLVSALRELASRISQTVTCRFECQRSLRVPSESIALNLYRIAQEAVTNSLKHAKPNEVVICIERQSNDIILSIKDDGTPRRRSKRNGGMGIQMMQYRASVSGGRLTVETNRGGKGTKVTCQVPAKM